MSIWLQGQGVEGFESDQSYDRFQKFLQLGPTRTLVGVAELLSVSHQSVQQSSKRYNWRARARAYDLAHPRKDAGPAVPPVPGKRGQRGVNKPKPKPKQAKEEPKQPKPPKGPPIVVTPEVLDQAAATVQGGDHLQALQLYRRTYELLGQSMAGEASDVLPLIVAFREDLQEARKLWRRLIDQGDAGAAAAVSTQMRELIPGYCRLCEAMQRMAEGGRLHWGEAIGVHGLLERAFGRQA